MVSGSGGGGGRAGVVAVTESKMVSADSKMISADSKMVSAESKMVSADNEDKYDKNLFKMTQI